MVQDEKGERMSIIGGPNPAGGGKIEYTVFRSRTSCSATRLHEHLKKVSDAEMRPRDEEALSIGLMMRMYNSGASTEEKFSFAMQQVEKIVDQVEK